MLVLNRRSGEEILIGDDVVVTVLKVRSDCVRIGITAPKRISIVRTELLSRESFDKEWSDATAGATSSG